MNEEMMTTGFTAGDTATGPTAGFDPVIKMRAKLKDLKGLVAPGNKIADPTVVKKKKVKEDWKPEIEVVDTNKRKKEAEKKRKEAADSLPPHLRLDVMKKAFAQKIKEARNTRADANTLRSVSTPAMQGKKGNVNLKGRSVTGGASMGGMNIRAAGGLGKSKPHNVDSIVAKYRKQVKSDRLAATKQRAKEKAGVSEAIAPSPQEIQVHKKISMLQQKLAQLRKKTVNQAAKGAAQGENEVQEGVVDRFAPKHNLLQYKLNIPGVGETVVTAASPAELRQKMRILINPRFRADVEIERILPYDAYKFFTDKRAKALKRK